jgi:NitT/TauT family transport system ATP-binding protein/sulfonate transport system ATP-binding protein
MSAVTVVADGVPAAERGAHGLQPVASHPTGRASESHTSEGRLSDRPVLIDIQHVSRTYQADEDAATHALEDVSLTVREGEFVSLIGPSGCGKTTLLRLVAGLDVPQAGTLSVADKPIEGSSHERGYVFQQGALYPWATVAANIATGLRARGVYRQQKHRVAQFIDLVGLSGFEEAYPHQISGGMQQRVAIARALINEPQALLLDEPMGALDSFTRMELQDKLIDLWRELDSTMLLVTHDVDEAVYLSDRIVIMTPRPGRISEIIEVDLGRPRLRNSPDFLRLRSLILEKLHLAGSRPEPEFTI